MNTQTQLEKAIIGLETFSEMFNRGYNSNKPLIECLLISNKIKALQSLTGGKLELACAVYLLLTNKPTNNMLVLFLVSNTMAIAKAKRIGWKKASLLDLSIDIGLFLVYYKELSKPSFDLEALIKEYAENE